MMRPSTQKNSNENQVLEGKIFAVLAYLSILCIIPLVFKKDNPFALTHGKQGLVIFVGEGALFVIHIVLGAWVLKYGLFLLGVCSFVGIISALKGDYIRLPLISDIAQKITL